MLPKVVKHIGAHELFMNICVVVGQWYYFIDWLINMDRQTDRQTDRHAGRRVGRQVLFVSRYPSCK